MADMPDQTTKLDRKARASFTVKIKGKRNQRVCHLSKLFKAKS